MKLQALVATLSAAIALGGSAIAQVTMQPIPNPPEKPMMAHKHMMKHHMMKKHMASDMSKDSMSKGTTDTPPAPAPQ